MNDPTNHGVPTSKADQRAEDVRRILSAPDPFTAAAAAQTEIATRKAILGSGEAAEAVAFLATYNQAPSWLPQLAPWPPAPGSPPLPFPVPPPPPPPPTLGGRQTKIQTVYPLVRGVNRIGWDDWFCDFREPRCSSTDSRQWLILIAGRRALVVDDAASNPSYVLRRSAPRLTGADPRFDVGASGIRREPENMIPLDSQGDTIVELFEGDTLVVVKGPHVFGWVGAGSSEKEAPMEAPEVASSPGLPGPATTQHTLAREILIRATDATNLSMHVCSTTSAATASRRAFLASFTSPTTNVIFPMRHGRNRIGWGLFGGDFKQPPFAPCHETQWVVLMMDRCAWIATFVPAFSTLVLPARSPSHAMCQDILADESARAQLLEAPPPDSVVLDRWGRGYHQLADGDILVTRQAALVFGWLPEEKE